MRMARRRNAIGKEKRKCSDKNLSQCRFVSHKSSTLCAPLTSGRRILNIYSTNIRTEYFKNAAQSPFFSLQNAVYFTMLPCLVPVLFTF
jgi:hypothetical protein